MQEAGLDVTEHNGKPKQMFECDKDVRPTLRCDAMIRLLDIFVSMPEGLAANILYILWSCNGAEASVCLRKWESTG
jgi:hypothetical protein